MCILFIARDQRKDFPLIIAANRDEFHARPTKASHIWSSHPPIFAGKDLKAGGTWMGVTRSGRIAALTNIRQPDKERQDARTRGELVVNYLTHKGSNPQFHDVLRRRREKYNGFNLLHGTWRDLKVYNNESDSLLSLEPGIHGLSNGALNDPWPKVSRGVSALSQYCSESDTLSEDALFSLLKDKTEAPESALPDTGISKDWEKRLSPIFIQSDEYGTRASTLLLVNRNGNASWSERTYDIQGQVTDQVTAHFQFL
ncbi:NRDE family protein [Salinimonas sp. HHU 13199]|uniref:NRDE family protein n=1 Tax=Salinimonas profundi TaxID=2729140 RepID=A0ABR8LEG9_9ALTE|nr:NRDE family protein [Salinimonas profundi]MBD3584680.1 NRDE family protein [Salinimonas profundi]